MIAPKGDGAHLIRGAADTLERLTGEAQTMTGDVPGRWGGTTPCLTLMILACAACAWAAQERSPFPEYTGGRVYAQEVPGDYSRLDRAIQELERTSPQTYFAVVVRTVGKGPDAVTTYTDSLYDAWRGQARARGLKLDPERHVIVLAALDDRRVAVRAGSSLADRFGLSKATRSALIDRAFAPLAREQKYPEAIASLLAALHNEVAQHDSRTAAVKTGTDLFPALPAGALTGSSKPVEVPAAPRPPQVQTVQAQPRGGSTAAAQSSGYRDLWLALAGSILAVGLIVGVLIWLARRRTRNTVEGKIKEYRKKAVEAMDQLDALKARIKRLPAEDPDFQEPMAGETLSVYEQTETNLTGLWDRWLEVMDILDKAQALAQKDSALGTQKLKQAEQLVSDSRAFEQITEQSKACAASMDRLNQAHEDARSAAEVLVEREKEIVERVDRVAKEGLPTLPYQPESQAISAQAAQAREVLTPDPIGARRTLDNARERAVALRDRVQAILERYDEAREASASLKSLGEEVAAQRRSGLRLDEDGGNPDHPIAQTFQRLEALRKAVHEGDPKAALEQLQEAQGMLRQSRQTLSGVLEARALCEKDVSERAGETRRLREAMPQYEVFEAELKRDFAASSWQAVAGHLAQARALLETFDAKTGEAAQAGSATNQRYLQAARLLGQVRQEQAVVFQLMNAVSEQIAALRALREECRNLRQALDERAHAADLFLQRHEQAVCASARSSHDAAVRSRRQVEAQWDESRPDWPRIRQALARAIDEMAIAQSQAEADVRIHQQLSEELERTRRDAGRVRSFLAGHEEDRVAANQHYQNAERALTQVQSQSRGSGGEWARWLELVRGAGADLARAEQLAQEDIRLAHQAESEIEEAARTIRKARGYFSMGVSLSTMGAEAQAAQADQLYRSQNYEQAIRAAAAAIQQVREAYSVAAQQAHARQMAVEAGRRRFPVAPMAGAAIGLGGAAAAASIESDESGEAPPASTTAAGSWSSETAEGGW